MVQTVHPRGDTWGLMRTLGDSFNLVGAQEVEITPVRGGGGQGRKWVGDRLRGSIRWLRMDNEDKDY